MYLSWHCRVMLTLFQRSPFSNPGLPDIGILVGMINHVTHSHTVLNGLMAY
jgi:hypothetical protein